MPHTVRRKLGHDAWSHTERLSERGWRARLIFTSGDRAFGMTSGDQAALDTAKRESMADAQLGRVLEQFPIPNDKQRGVL